MKRVKKVVRNLKFVVIPPWLNEAFGNYLIDQRRNFINFEKIQSTLMDADLENFIQFQGVYESWLFKEIINDFDSIIPSEKYSDEELVALFKKHHDDSDLMMIWNFSIIEDVIICTPRPIEIADTALARIDSIKNLFYAICNNRAHNHVVKLDVFRAYSLSLLERPLIYRLPDVT